MSRRAQWQAEKAQVPEGRRPATPARKQAETEPPAGPGARTFDLDPGVDDREPGTIPALRRQLEALEGRSPARRQGQPHQGGGGGGRGDIADGRSGGPAVPVSKLLEGEVQKLLHLDAELPKRVSARDEASRRRRGRRRARSGLKDPNRPSVGTLPGPDRCRQNGAGHAAPWRVPLRRRACDGPHRHVGSTRRSTRWRLLAGRRRVRRLRGGAGSYEAVRRGPNASSSSTRFEKAHTTA